MRTAAPPTTRRRFVPRPRRPSRASRTSSAAPASATRSRPSTRGRPAPPPGRRRRGRGNPTPPHPRARAPQVAKEPPAHLPNLLLLFLLSYAHKLAYDPSTATLVKRKPSYPIDGYVVVVGVATLLKQCHPAFTRALLDALGQFVCANAAATPTAADPRARPLAPEVLNAVWFVDALCRVSRVPRPDAAIPAHIFAEAYKTHGDDASG